MIDEATKAKVEAVIKELDAMISQLIAIKGKLEAIYTLQVGDATNSRPAVKESTGAQAHSYADGKAKIVEEFPMPNPDALNRGPLRWLLHKLEEEQAKGHMEAWHAIQGNKVRFEIKLRPEASKDDRKKLEAWFSWARKALRREVPRHDSILSR